ncbi:TRAP transporter fused permease subunit [Nocardia yamanashiensis]|uniref:TRAP transporter permease n=1 Tax=Nocardia yamanashiensis TaxID=209247 RepID=UPI001E2B160B|nr:TRAP transporter fused permease subunit [Nocardia yamanashiensis]UGT41451.1 TRAP transporter fused permease subunit [Nocardia yamanashiensis]
MSGLQGERPDSAVPAELVVDDEERPARQLPGWAGRLVALCAFAIAVLVLWQVFRPLPQGSQYFLVVFLGCALPLVFLSYSSGIGVRWLDRMDGPAAVDWVLAAIALAVCLYPVWPWRIGSGGGGYNDFLDRQGLLDPVDVGMGAVTLLLVLEACRRTTGWVLPVVCLAFLGYGYYGGFLPQHWSIAHAGLDFDQIVDALYNSGSGFYGTPLDVAASYIVLFTIYGAVLDFSGAARFFVDLSVSLFRRSRSAAGRTAVTSGFLLGTVSGSGTATAVSTGVVTWPILRRAGYRPEQAGGMLAAAGVGAILSPPTLGAAAFIVAEYLDVSYLRVLVWATIPTLLYYLGILLAVEIDARRFPHRAVDPGTESEQPASAWKLLGRFGYHFLSLIAIVVLLIIGVSATRAVVYATVLAFLLAIADRLARQRNSPERGRLGEFALGTFTALSMGIRAALPVVAVCTAAGIITAMTTKTGLGSQLAALLVRAASAISDNATVVLAFTVVFAAVALALLGLAIPVTASFVIGWAIIGPALLTLGVSAPATAMFVFYFSVLSEVTPPTALAAVGAAAVTGARPMATMWQTLRYALPAFLVPIVFVLTGSGERLLGRGSAVDIITVTALVSLGVAALAMATGGWILGAGQANTTARLAAGAAGLALLYPSPITLGIGVALLAVAAALTRLGTRPAGVPAEQEK